MDNVDSLIRQKLNEVLKISEELAKDKLRYMQSRYEKMKRLEELRSEVLTLGKLLER